MIAAALLLAAQVVPQSAVEAETAFAADAEREGQWTAFRKWAAPEAVMFDPQPTTVEKLLGALEDPPASVRWWPSESYVSCDGAAAVNHGVARWPDGAGGWFSTVWQRDGGAWRWTLDQGARTATPAPRPATVSEKRSSCAGTPPLGSRGFPKGEGGGASADRTLRWHWRVASDGERWFTAEQWTGERYETVLTDHAPATPKQ